MMWLLIVLMVVAGVFVWAATGLMQDQVYRVKYRDRAGKECHLWFAAGCKREAACRATNVLPEGCVITKIEVML